MNLQSSQQAFGLCVSSERDDIIRDVLGHCAFHRRPGDEPDPGDWYGEVQAEKVTLAEARGDWAALLRAAVDREVRRLKNESLARKIEVLHAVCKPGSAQILKGYAYEAARLKEIDQFRHRTVHQRIDPSPFDVSDAVAFMERTQVYLSALVTHRHGLKLGPDAMNAVF